MLSRKAFTKFGPASTKIEFISVFDSSVITLFKSDERLIITSPLLKKFDSLLIS